MENPDMTLAVEFFVKPVELKAKSREEGRPIFEDREYVRIRFPADNKRELVAPAHEKHYVSHARQQMTYAERFQASYQAWKQNDAEFISGTPLTELPALTSSRREELRAQNIRTVEQLAGVTDAAGRKLGMGWREEQEAAQAYLDAAKGTSEVAELKRQLEELRAQLSSQKEASPAPAPKADKDEALGSEFAGQFEGMSDDDLKNMIRDAGGKVPRGGAGREKLLIELQRIAGEKEAA